MEFVVLHIFIVIVVGLIRWSAKPDKVDLEVAREQGIRWSFDELLKTLILFSLPADEQKETIGPGHVTQEMVDDFEEYYTFEKYAYIGLSLINEEQKKLLDDLELFLDERQEYPDNGFMDDELLDSDADREAVRETARKILKLLGKDDLTVAYERKQQGNSVFTKINLVKKVVNERPRQTPINY